MKTNNLRTLITPLTLVAVCLSWNATLDAQQPFDSLTPTQQNPTPTEDVQDTLPSNPPLQVRPQGERFPSTPFITPRDQPRTSDQPILLNAKFAGWEGAAVNPVDGKRIANELRGSWIMVDPNGRFEGQVTAAAGADVKGMNVFLMNMGRLVKQTTVDSEGRFDFTNVRQGAYSLIGWGSNGLFTFGVNIISHNPINEGKLSTHIDVMAFQNKSTINTDWIRYFSPSVGFRVYGRYPTGEGRDDPTSLYGFFGLYNNLPPFTPATSITNRTVSPSVDGRLVGRVHQMNSLSGRPVDVRTTKVMLLENDSVVASTSTDNLGIFEFRDVPDGTYGVLAAGVDGVGLIAVRVESAAPGADGEAQQGVSDSIDFTLISSETIGWLNHYAAEVAYRRGLLAPRPPAPNQQPVCANCANAAGGCAACQLEYLKSTCRSRGLTFEQWQAYGCQGVTSGFGDGNFLREVGENMQRRIKKVDSFYEGVFYPNSGGDLPALNNQGYNNQGYNNQGYNNQGYNNQGYNNQGYNNQGYNNQGYNNQGYNNQGYNNQGYNNQGYNNQGYNNQGFGVAPGAAAQQVAPNLPIPIGN